MHLRHIDFSRAQTVVLVAGLGSLLILMIGCSGGGAGGTPAGTGGGGAVGGGGGTGAGGGSATGSGGSIGSGGMSGGSGGLGADASLDVAATDDARADAPMEAAADVPTGPFALTSAAFSNGTEVPLMYKCDQVTPRGMNISPPLGWTPGPAGTRSYAMTLIHDAADLSKHWLMWDIPSSVTSLPMNVEHVAMPAMPAGATQAHVNLDGFNGFGYLGPCPQALNSRQMYLYAVYALKVDKLPNVTSNSASDAVYSAIQANMVPGGKATLSGTQIQQ